MARRITIRVDDTTTVTGLLAMPRERIGTGVLLAHGAGLPQTHPWMVAVRDGIAARGIPTLSFNYAYTEAGRKSPDRLAKLIEVHRAAADRLSGYVERVVLAGKSMGGRVASHLAGDEGWPAAGLVYLGYPLVPMGRSEPRSTEHLERIGAPQLFVAGTRDRLSPPALVVPLAGRLPAADVHVVAHGDHSLKVTKKAGVANEVVLAAVTDVVAAWVRRRVA